MSTPKRQRKEINYKEDNIPDEEYKIPSETSEWDEVDLVYFNVKFENLDLIANSLPDLYENLVPKEWNEEEIIHADIASLSSKSRSIIKGLRAIIGIERNDNNKEVEVDSFINSLFNKLEFNDDPYKIFSQYKCSINIQKRKIITKPDFVISKDGIITIIIEDKHRFNANVYNSWGEYQLVGEIIICAHYIASTKEKIKPTVINAIRVVGTSFTFYRTEISSKYILETYKSKPKDNLIIKRYPPKGSFDEITALNFCRSEDRLKIFNMIYSLYER